MNNHKNKYNITSEDYGIGYTSKNEEFYFDLEDYDKIKDYCWHSHEGGYIRTCYDSKRIGKKTKNKYIMLHNLLIFGFDKKDDNIVVDHINGLANDNRRKNIRVVTRSENMKNLKLNSRNKSGHKGVHWSEREQKWKAYIYCDKKSIHLGTFKNKEDAINARERAEEKYFGKLSRKREDLNNGTTN